MAREIGLDSQTAVRAAFVHDIGKAIDRDLQGTHLELGIDFLRQHGENAAVVDAVAAHHMDIDWPSLEAMIVQAADAVSAARPGARRDILESYIKRLEKLEGIADSFKGVSKAFALQAGREIRIMVESEKITDEEAIWLSKDIARRIENELEYPGQIKVTVIRGNARDRLRTMKYGRVGRFSGFGTQDSEVGNLLRNVVKPTPSNPESTIQNPELTVAELGEHALLERIRARAPASPPWVAVGVGDDAAVVEPARGHLGRHHGRRTG